jgi:hypothetical protein
MQQYVAITATEIATVTTTVFYFGCSPELEPAVGGGRHGRRAPEIRSTRRRTGGADSTKLF